MGILDAVDDTAGLQNYSGFFPCISTRSECLHERIELGRFSMLGAERAESF